MKNYRFLTDIKISKYRTTLGYWMYYKNNQEELEGDIIFEPSNAYSYDEGFKIFVKIL